MSAVMLSNGPTYDHAESVDGWGDDPFTPPEDVDTEAAELAHKRATTGTGQWERFTEPATVSVPLAVLARAAEASLSATQGRVLALALMRGDTFGVAEFGRGELARLVGVRTNNVARELRALADAGIIASESTAGRVILRADDAEAEGSADDAQVG